jgi:hypothetical protein
MFRSLRFLLPILAAVALAFPARAQYVVKVGTAHTIPLPDMIDASTHIAGLTGQTGNVYLTTIPDSGAAITTANSTNTIAENSAGNAPGQYRIALTAGELGTLGYVKGYYKSAGSDPVSFTIRVLAYNPDDGSLLGLTGVATAAAQTTNGTNISTLLTRLGTPVGASISADLQTRMATFGLPSNFSLLSIDGSGKTALQAAEHTAIQTDAATGVLNSMINGHTFKDLLTILGFNPAGTITSVTRSSSSPWTTTTVYADGSATATYVSTFTNNTFTVQIGRPTVTFTGLP